MENKKFKIEELDFYFDAIREAVYDMRDSDYELEAHELFHASMFLIEKLESRVINYFNEIIIDKSSEAGKSSEAEE